MILLDGLGRDITFYICSFLRLSDLGSLGSINRSMYSLLQADSIWRAIFLDEEIRWRRPLIKNEDAVRLYRVPNLDDEFLMDQTRLHAPHCNPAQASWKTVLRNAQKWRFDPSIKPDCLELSKDNTSVLRSSRQGCNPIQLCSRPFMQYRNSITFQLVHIGSWLRIGFADRSIPLTDGSLLGDHKDGTNVGLGREGGSSYSSSIYSSNVDVLLDLPHSLKDGNLITIVWLQELNTFNILVDGRLKKILQINSKVAPMVFPCVQLSFNSQVRLMDDGAMCGTLIQSPRLNQKEVRGSPPKLASIPVS